MKLVWAVVCAAAVGFVPAGSAISKTVGLDGAGLSAVRTGGTGGRPEGASWFLRFGPLLGTLTLSQEIPVPPLPARGGQVRGWLAFSPTGEGTKTTGQAPQRSGAQHRKAFWPDLDFTGHGHTKATKVRGGGGGWDDMPGGGVPIGGGTNPGGSTGGGTGGTPGGNQGGGTEMTGPDPDILMPPEAISPVPVPAAGWLLAAAVGGLALARRRRAA